jgi:CHAT domain-containing protein
VQVAVLSACSTAAGDPRPAEGALGVAQAFLAAGVPSVVATLWPVDDGAARDLMLAFHRALSQGLPPAAALRQAQLAVMESAPSGPSIGWEGFIALGGR